MKKAATDESLQLSRRSLVLGVATGCAASSARIVPQTPSPISAKQSLEIEFETLGSIVETRAGPRQKRIVDLQVWEGRVYAGYGDWYTNTGPVPAKYYDTVTGQIVHDEGYLFSEEAVQTFTVLNGVLYAVGADALSTETWEFGNLYRKAPGYSWEKLRTVPGGVHVFGVGQVGGVLVAAGSDQYANGVIWQSWDSGYTWETVTVLDSPSPDAGDPLLVRSYIGTMSDRVIVSTPTHGCFMFDGVSWSNVSWESVPRNGFNHAVQHGPNVAMVAYLPETHLGHTNLYITDGITLSTIDLEANVLDLVVLGDLLCVLTSLSNGTTVRIIATTEPVPAGPESFETLAEGRLWSSAQALSMEYAESRFYLGCADGTLIRTPQIQL